MYKRISEDSIQEFFGYSTENKPLPPEVSVDDTFYEMDTQTTYYFNGEKWEKQTVATNRDLVGKMDISTYDRNSVVANAGGIKEFVNEEIKGINGIVENPRYQKVTSEITHYYIARSDGKIIEDKFSNMMTFSVVEGEKYRISGHYQFETVLYGLYADVDAKAGIVIYPQLTASTPAPGISETIEVVIPSGVSILRACSYQANPLVEKCIGEELRIIVPNTSSDNVLYDKKWAVCGDSFTYGDFSHYTDSEGHSGRESDAYDPITQHYKTYPWWINQRNNMQLKWLAMGGNDFVNIESATRPFSNPDTENYNYTQIPNDCDYVTLQFGLNEHNLTAEQIGTKTDTTNETLWGAYNLVLESILTANPFVKIGIIISDAWMSQEYHDALIEIATYWGIPYLDLKNGANMPMMIGGEFREHSAVAQTIRDTAFRINSTDSHPNLQGHKYRSTIIENFLRSL